MFKPEVEKAFWVTKETLPHIEPRDIYLDIVAYCKGKNGHYYLVEYRYGGMTVVRLQRRTQYHQEEIYISRDDRDALLDIKEPSKEGLALFERIVREHKPHRAPKTVDPQRNRCYRWEAQFGNRSTIRCKFLSKEETIAMSTKLAQEAGVKTPHISFSKAGTSWARGSREVKYYTETGRVSDKTIIHEMAHIIDYAKNDRGRNHGHGPKFIGIYIKLLVKHMGYDIKYLEDIAKEFKLKIEYPK